MEDQVTSTDGTDNIKKHDSESADDVSKRKEERLRKKKEDLLNRLQESKDREPEISSMNLSIDTRYRLGEIAYAEKKYRRALDFLEPLLPFDAGTYNLNGGLGLDGSRDMRNEGKI